MQGITNDIFGNILNCVQVPVLDVGDFSLPQSKAIERYVVARLQFAMTRLFVLLNNL